MVHKLIHIKDFSLSFAHKICFQDFNCQVPYGSRIGIIGKNGSGKSTLLKMIAALCASKAIVGYIPQVIDHPSALSGGERFNKALMDNLSLDPDILLLDEPTNHLDSRNRKHLMRVLEKYTGTLVVVSHDKAFLRDCINVLWHIDSEKIHVFAGHYDNYIHEVKLKREAVENELKSLKRQKEGIHEKWLQEQKRAAKSKAKGEKSVHEKKWPKMLGKTKAGRAQETFGRKSSLIEERKRDLNAALAELSLPKVIIPKFSINTAKRTQEILVQVSNGSVGYAIDKPLLSNIHFRLQSADRMAITGDNGKGKSTLIKAIMGDQSIYKTGEWSVIKQGEIGYLDQHYGTLDEDKTVLEVFSEGVRDWPHHEVRRHLNDFLFSKNEAVMAFVKTLSGGEKVRLNLACIAAKTPKFLIFDEVTNNLDLETREHVIQVLRAYPGGLMVISHDIEFLESIGIHEWVAVENFRVS